MGLSFINYDDIECPKCGREGVLPAEDFDVVCPQCGFRGSVLQEEGYSEEDLEEDE